MEFNQALYAFIFRLIGVPVAIDFLIEFVLDGVKDTAFSGRLSV